MANMDDTIGFEAQADPSKALQGLGEIEGAINDLSKAIASFNRSSRLLPIDTKAFNRALGEAQKGLRGLERSTAALNANLANIGKRDAVASAKAMAKAYADALKDIQSQAAATRTALGGMAPGGTRGSSSAGGWSGGSWSGSTSGWSSGAWSGGTWSGSSGTAGSGWAGGSGGSGSGGAGGSGSSGGGRGRRSGGSSGGGGAGGSGSGGAGGGAGGAGGSGSGSASGGAGSTSRGPLGGVGQAVGGLAGVIGLGGVVAYLLQAMREQAEEYTRQADLGIRLGGRGGIAGFTGTVRPAGASMGFTREEAMSAAEGLGAMTRQTLNAGDLEATLRAARAVGVSGSTMGSLMGRAGKGGVIGEGDVGGFTAMLAAGAAAGGMQARQVEASEAAVDLLSDLSDSIGDLSESSRQGMLYTQAFLAATGKEEFRGQRGAQVIRRMGDAIAPGGGSETSESLLNIALTRYGTLNGKRLSGGSPLDLMLARENKASPENMKAIGHFIQQELGGYNEKTRGIVVPIVKELLGFTSFGQAERFMQSTNLVRDKGGIQFGQNAALDKVRGQNIIDRNVAAMNASEGGLARQVARKDEDIRRAVGSAAFAVVKPMQDAFLSLGKMLADNITPGFKSLGEQLKQLNDEFQKGGVEGVLRGRAANVAKEAAKAAAEGAKEVAEDAGADALPIPQGFGASNFSAMSQRGRDALLRGQRAMANAHAHHDSPRGEAYARASRDINQPGDFTPGQLITAGRPYILEARGGKGAPAFLNGYGANAVALREAEVDPVTGKYSPTARRVVIGHQEKLFRDFKPGHQFVPGEGIGYAQASSGNPALHGVSTGPHIHIHGENASAWGAGSSSFFRPDDKSIGLGDTRWVPGKGPKPIKPAEPPKPAAAPVPPPIPPAPKAPQQHSALPVQYSATVNQTFVIGNASDADKLRGVVRRETEAAILSAREAAIARAT